MLFKPDEEDRVALEQDPRVFLPAYYGPFGWLGLDLTGQVAPRAMLARLDAEGGPAGRLPAS